MHLTIDTNDDSAGLCTINDVTESVHSSQSHSMSLWVFHTTLSIPLPQYPHDVTLTSSFPEQEKARLHNLEAQQTAEPNLYGMNPLLDRQSKRVWTSSRTQKRGPVYGKARGRAWSHPVPLQFPLRPAPCRVLTKAYPTVERDRDGNLEQTAMSELTTHLLAQCFM
jgi:hypothetical protein